MFTIANQKALYTSDGLELYNRYKNGFGNIVMAQMKSLLLDPKSELHLINEHGEEMLFKGCFTSGYTGEGPRGTYTVLKDAGFDVSEDFICNNKTFEIKK